MTAFLASAFVECSFKRDREPKPKPPRSKVATHTFRWW
jgi:hypothetical protein